MALTDKERKWIQEHFDKVDERFDKMNDRFTDVLVEIAKLKVKAGIWGGIGAAVIVVFAYLIRK